jgi:catechol 2,3-dioxygenase
VTIRGIRDHRVSQSIYLEDPDGNTVELFVDGDPTIWAGDPSAVATIKPLTLG